MSAAGLPVILETSGSAQFEFWASNLERAGRLAPDTPGLVEGRAGHAGAGGEVEFTLSIRSDRIEAVRYRFRGSPWIGAACAFYARLLEGQPASVRWPPAAELAGQLGYPRVRYDEVLIVEDALMAALAARREVCDE
jgi:hypothetical protein